MRSRTLRVLALAALSVLATGASSAANLTAEQCGSKLQAVDVAFASPEGYAADQLKRGRYRIDPLDEQFNQLEALQCAELARGRPLTQEEQNSIIGEYSGQATPGWLTRARLLGVVLPLAAQVTTSGQCIKLSEYETNRQCKGAPGCSADYRNPTVMAELANLDSAYSKSIVFSKSDFCPEDAQRVLTTAVKRMVEHHKQQPLYQLLKP